uniref:Uncharacterized protein n=1 Tax=viral metagenome TaxID=1070528 RepID=A0A6M3K1M6_9ZZZZ
MSEQTEAPKAQQVKSQDITQLNKGMTKDMWKMLQQASTQGQQGMEQYSPENLMAYMQDVIPGVMDMSGQMISPFAQAGMNQANMESVSAGRRIGAGAEGGNSLFSGAFAKAYGQGVAQPYTNLATNVAQMQGQLGGGLAGMFGGQYGAMGDRYANLRNTALGAGAQFSQPNYVLPQYYQPNSQEGPTFGSFMGKGISGAAAGAGIGTAIAPGIGTGIGAGLGFLTGGLADLFSY